MSRLLTLIGVAVIALGLVLVHGVGEQGRGTTLHVLLPGVLAHKQGEPAAHA